VRVIESDVGASHAMDLMAIIEAQRARLPILVTRDRENRQRVFMLEPQDERLWVGRGPACDVRIDWDEKASRSHAELVRVPDGWAVVDDGLSRNGTFVAGERIVGRRRLRDGDVVRFGDARITYRLPTSSGASTVGPAVPASNRAIAAELVLSVEAIKTHMRTLFGKFAVEDLPQNQKRARLAELAMQAGLVSEHER